MAGPTRPRPPDADGPATAGGPPGAGTEVDLLLRLARRWRRMALAGSEDLGLTPHQQRALLALSRLDTEVPGHGVRVSALAQHLGIAARSATEVADALEDAGLLGRAPDPTDRRAVLLRLTGAGREVVDAVRERRRSVAERALGALDATDRAQLRRLLATLLEADPQAGS